MSEHSSVPVVVVSGRQDDAEAVSRALRNLGLPAHCSWVGNASALPDAVPTANPELMFVFSEPSLGTCLEYRDRHAAEMPVIAVAPEVSEDAIHRVLAAGAQDLVSLRHEERLQAVAMRELQNCRRARELAHARRASEEYQRRVESMVSASRKALIFANEGIVLSINPACLELLGYPEDEDLTGMPVMDFFESESQTALKGALVACARGKWAGHALRSRASCSDGSALTVETLLDEDTIDGEPCVRVELREAHNRQDELAEQSGDFASSNPLSPFHHRRAFFVSLAERLAGERKGGLRALYHIRPDRLSMLLERWGPLGCDELLLGMARIISGAAKPDDLHGQIAGGAFAVLVARGNERDVTAWAEHVRSMIAQQAFVMEGESVRLSASIGIAIADDESTNLPELFGLAGKASRIAQEQGGNRVLLQRSTELTPEQTLDDRRAVASIKSALMRDSFRLVFQPIANLQEQSCHMFDVLLRMLDGNGREILPNHFLPAAERNGLMKAVDRWVLANAVKSAAEQTDSKLFVRLSEHSLSDNTLVPWLAQQLEKDNITPQRIVVQVTESVAESHLQPMIQLVAALKQLGCGFAIEHFGVGEAPIDILGELDIDFMKVDGSLMQGLADDAIAQQQVQSFVTAAKQLGIVSIAERVEDAHTMAVLWQLGVEFIQGYYVQGPEEVVLETA